MKNLYYFKRIQKIGGIETFFYQLAKKYQDIDITIVYDYAEPEQLKRLKEYVRCIKNKGQHFECEKAFFNFNTDIIDNVEAKEYNLVIHGNYKWLVKNSVPKHSKINNYYAVSKDSAKAFTELTGIKCGVIYNPLEKIEVKKPLILVSASRLDDKIKGAKRMQTLANELDRYCEETGNNYMWIIFTNNFNGLNGENICYMNPRLNILPYMKLADYVVQLSDNVEGYNYTVNESLYVNNVPVVITPCDVYKELGIDNTMSIQLDFDMKNIKEVVKDMFNKKLKVNYEAPKDTWDKIFAIGKSTYQEERKIIVKARVLKDFFDLTERESRKENDVFELTKSRAEEILEVDKLIEIIEEEPKVETKVEIKPIKKKTATKRW